MTKSNSGINIHYIILWDSTSVSYITHNIYVFRYNTYQIVLLENDCAISELVFDDHYFKHY